MNVFFDFESGEGLKQACHSGCFDVCKSERKNGEMSPVEATPQQTTGRWEDWELLSAHLGVFASREKQPLLSAPQKSDYFNHCKHLLSFVSESLTIYVTPSQVLGPCINRRSTLFPRLQRHGASARGSHYTLRVCVCVWWVATVVEK